jgi:serine/threonine protein kinase
MSLSSDDKTSFGPSDALGAGTVVAHYTIVSKIGAGGMGEVYLADDSRLNRRVALKFLPTHLAADPTLRTRFTREVQAVAALNHPNIIHVYEVSDFSGRPYFAMEFVQGQSLRDKLHDGRLPITESLAIAIGLCRGLESAHNVGIVHRDIKPANIIVAPDGLVKILDFGLAKRSTDPTITSMGSTLGTICYMSPEQVQGKESDQRSDLFSVGILLYEMVAGRLPFRGDYDAATLTAIVSDPQIPLLNHRPDAPPELQKIVDRLLNKSLEKRYQSAGELLADLTNLLDDLRYSSREETAKHGTVRNRGPLMFMVAGGVVVVAIVAYFLFRPRPQTVANNEAPSSTTVPPSAGKEPSKPQPAPGTVNQPAQSQSMKSPAAASQNMKLPPQTAAIAESIATAAHSKRLQQINDSIEAGKARLGAAATTQTQPATQNSESRPSTEGSDRPAETLVPALGGAERAADSSAARAALDTFWKHLESGHIGDLKSVYPGLPRDAESNWRTFVDYAKDLKVKLAVSSMKMSPETADASFTLHMDFRDRSGQKSQDVGYRAALAKEAGHWIIKSMDRNR